MTKTTTAGGKETGQSLHGTGHGSDGKALCPAHKDRRPSLSVTPGRNAVLFHCFAGCTQAAIMDALSRQGAHIRPTTPDPDPPQKRDLAPLARALWAKALRSEEHPSELQSLMRISYAVFCLKKQI